MGTHAWYRTDRGFDIRKPIGRVEAGWYETRMQQARENIKVIKTKPIVQCESDKKMGKDKILFWFLFRRVVRAKKFLLWEAELDKHFFETEMKEQLEYSDAKDREMLVTENNKPAADRNAALIAEIENRIVTAKAVKASYRKTLELLDEVTKYLKMLSSWKNKN